MKQTLKALLLLVSLIGLGTGSVQASEAQKQKPPVSKKKDNAAAKAPANQAKKNTTASGKQAATTGKKTTKTAANKPTGKSAQKSSPNVRKAVASSKKGNRVASADEGDFDPRRLALHSASVLVLDQTTGQPLLEKHPDTVVPIASISKLMTAMVVLDAGLDLNEVIAISEEDVDTLKGTRSRLPVGTTMTRETAMLLALMSSENRAANALGRHYPGGMPAFVAAMNRKAMSLGMFSSRFEEPTGLSSNNVATAHDLARMVAASANYPEIRHFSTTAEAKLELNGRVRDFGNTNALVRNDNWEIGVSKTGYISEAGRCLVMQARVADKPVVIVLLDSNGKMTRVGDANRIKRWMESAGIFSTRRTS
jgi:serine-type D-Ala-D-Ala endopeptidase (penicillin-binding protein 7)